VPCHGDWQPRNWLIDADLLVRTFDFEHARLSWWIHDLQRLVWQEWASTPSLARAFLDGYGRGLTDHELSGLWSSTAVGHIIQIVWATRHGDAGYAEEGREHLSEMRLPGGRERFFDRLLSHRSGAR
jgi:Ser/Thr protein kinase RdoA (MazF antagonist)